MPRFDISNGPSEAHAKFVLEWLRTHNASSNPSFFASLRDESSPLHVFAFEDQMLVSGLLGSTRGAWLRIDVMATHPAHRGQGLGRSLISTAEREAAARGCRWIYADTMEHQGPDFYLKCGFTRAGHLPDWDSNGTAKILLIKQIRTPEE